MNRVTVTREGVIVHEGTVIDTEPLMYLGFETLLEDGFTLRSFFRAFDKYPRLQKLNAFFSSYMDQYKASPKDQCIYDGFDRLEFGKTVEMIGFPGKPRLEIYHSLFGVAGNEAVEIRSVPLENMLDMPLKLGKLKHIVFGDKVDVLEFDTVFNLFEFIDGIMWELGFQGTLTACELRR